MDFTVRTRTVILCLYGNLSANGSELVCQHQLVAADVVKLFSTMVGRIEEAIARSAVPR